MTIHKLLHGIKTNDNTIIDLVLTGDYGDSTVIFTGTVNDLYHRFGYNTLNTVKYQSFLYADDLNTMSINIKLF